MIKLLHRPLRFRIAATLIVVAGLSAPLGVTGPQALAMSAAMANGSGPAVTAQPPAWPNCPAATEYCWVDIHFDTVISYCPNFTRSSGNCVGRSSGTPAFSTSSIFPPESAYFSWRGSGNRTVAFDKIAIYGGIVVVLRAEIIGQIPGPGNSNFSVNRAVIVGNNNGPWYTPNIPGVPAGSVGGPLYFRFRNGVIGADVYFHGYLRRVASGPGSGQGPGPGQGPWPEPRSGF
jgi:hypothetical protein